MAIENRLKKKLQGFYDNNIKNSFTPVQILKQKYDKQLRTILSAFIFEAYLFGIHHIQKQNNLGLDLAVTQNDMNNMQIIVDQQSENFWKTAEKLMQRRIEVDTINKFASLKLFDDIAAWIGNAAQTVIKSFNTAIKSKVSELVNRTSEGFDDIVTPTISPLSGKLKFVTSHDAKVCPTICEPLDGNIYNADDIDIPTPPDDTHIHCRCKLLPLLESE